MAKADFKAIMLARGEKFLLIGAVVIGALLLLWGVVAALGKGDPTVQADELKRGASGIRSKLNSTDAPPTSPKQPLPEFTPVNGDVFQAQSNQMYEPATWPDKFRKMPEALAPIDSQIDLFLVNVRKQARDGFKYNEDGEVIDFMGQWITTQVDTKVNQRDMNKDLRDSLLNRPKKPRAGGGQPTNPGVPGGPPGGPPKGGMSSGGMGDGAEGFGGGGPGMYGPGGMQLSKQKTAETVVEWRLYTDVLAAKQQVAPAYGVFPSRMAVVCLSYPLEEQLKEIQRALRLPTLRQAIAETSPDKLYATDPVSGNVVPYSSLVGGSSPVGPGVPGGPPGVPPGPPRGGVGVGMGDGAEGPGGPGSGSGPALTADKLAAPVFAGFVVQRRKIVNGETGEWEEFDHADRYFNEFTLYDAPVKPDTGYLPYFLRADQGLAAPMPQIAPNYTSIAQLVPGEAQPTLNKEGKPYYPEQVRMPSIAADTAALRKILEPVKKQDALKQYSRGGINPYQVGNSRLGASGPGIPGVPGGGDDGFGVQGSFGAGPGGKTGGGGGGAEFNKNPLAVKHMLIRFLDTDLLPGVSYQYQVKVKLRNPNFNKKKDVADEKLAEIEFIEPKSWFQCKQTLKVPGESYMYAGNIKEYEKTVDEMKDWVKKANPDKDRNGNAPDRLSKLFETQAVKDGKRAVVQMQKWVYSASFDAEDERIGAWVQAEIPVAPGEFIGRRTLVELPLWKAALGKYQLTPPKKPLVNGWPKEVTNQPLGRPVDFRTRHALIDYEGGRAKSFVDDRPVSDEATTELLILRDDGRLEVRKERDDAALDARKTRDQNWKDWIAEVRKQSEMPTTGTGPGGFEPGRGEGGSPMPPKGGR